MAKKETVSRTLAYNKSPISLREGSIFIDGVAVCDGVACTVKVTPETWSGKQLGEKTDSTRWLGYSITGSITRRRATPFLAEMIAKYKDTGITPEMKITGIQCDVASDFYATQGKGQTVTVTGCVPTGDITLISLDSEGDVLNDVINFNGKGIVIK